MECIETPEIQSCNLADAEEEQAQACKAKAELLYAERQKEHQHGLNPPGNRDHPCFHFEGQHEGDKCNGNKEQYLFGTADGCMRQSCEAAAFRIRLEATAQ